MAKKPHIGDLVDSVLAGLELVHVQYSELLSELHDLSERTEVANGGAVREMADKGLGYLTGLVKVVKVVKEGRPVQ